ncbi:MAG: ribonuclease HI [Phycisphaerae bacterium]|nr:ribonuclease HI [Phycisphaerae bacterium]
MKKVTIYTDGACQGNPGPGGWGVVLSYGRARRELAGACPATTNNQMELTAAIEGLRALKEACEVDLYTDSKYVQLGMREWLPGWKAKGWRRGRKPVKNLDLWQTLDAEASRHNVRWHWVKGHAANPGNERCDQLATEAIEKMRVDLGEDALRRALGEFMNRDDEERSLSSH